MSPVTTHQIGEELLDALGMKGQHVTSVQMKFDVNAEPVSIEVRQLIERPAAAWFVNVLRRFHLHEVPPPIEPGRQLACLQALVKAESFIAGFEGDELQEGIPELLAEIGAAIKQFQAPA